MNRKPWAKRPGAGDAHRLRGRKGVARRARWLEANPLCCMCQTEGRVTLGVIVDHRIPLAKGGADDESNLQTLCKRHDDIKFAIDQGHQPKTRLDANGRTIWD
jgi:5-methylcytosine-specific restriction endonuclease McrA